MFLTILLTLGPLINEFEGSVETAGASGYPKPILRRRGAVRRRIGLSNRPGQCVFL